MKKTLTLCLTLAVVFSAVTTAFAKEEKKKPQLVQSPVIIVPDVKKVEPLVRKVQPVESIKEEKKETPEVKPIVATQVKKKVTPKQHEVVSGKQVLTVEEMAFQNPGLSKRQIKKKIKKELKGQGEAPAKSQLVALLLCIFLGGLGVHRFYLGYIGIGIIQLLTAGGFGIWWLIDLIMLVTGSLEPKNGSYTETL